MQVLNRVFSTVGRDEYFSPVTFPWIKQVENRFEEIRSELDTILESQQVPNFQDISTHQRALTRDDRWKTFFLYAYGNRIEKNCELCPLTDHCLSTVPDIKTAMFSILAPGKEIPPHKGPYNGVLRYHLGLRIPEQNDQCGLKVNGKIAHWEEGNSLVFDDSYTHSAWNLTAEQRVVLFVDFVRPTIAPIDKLNRCLIRKISHTDFVREISHRQPDI